MKNKKRTNVEIIKENEIKKLKILEEIFWKEYKETKEIFNKTKDILKNNKG